MNAKSDFDTFWCGLEGMLKTNPSTNTVFNQYLDRNDEVDLADAPTIRLDNLRRYMAEATSTASILVVGEAAGPWGCRFTGVPFTGEKQLLDPSFPLRGRRSSKDVPSRSTKVSPPFISRSSEVFWSVMQPFHGRFLIWDVFPLHPHKQDDVLTVRNPTKIEVLQFREALRLIKQYMKPTNIVAVGRKAFKELEAQAFEELEAPGPLYVRHPSRGGIAKFTAGMKEIFEPQGTKR